MDSELIVRGKVLAQKQSNFEGKVSNTVQLMKRNAKGGVELMNVKLPESADPSKFAEGSNVELAVDVSTYEGSLYFKATRDMKDKADNRGNASATAKA